MKNFNRWRWPIAGVTALAIGTAALWPRGGEESPSPVAPASAGACTGNITGLTYETFTKDGDAFKVDAIEGGGCAPIYKPEDGNVIGSVQLGQTILACTFLGSTPNRLHVMNPISGEPYVVGDSNLTAKGVTEAGSEKVPSCVDLGIPDVGFRFPEDVPLEPTPVAPTYVTA